MKEKKKNTKILLPILLVALLIAMVGGATYAFFNYTRTGVANTLQVGRIAFNSTQNNTITLENVFPTATANLNSSNSDTVTITITGDTTYSEGIEYKVTLEDVNNTINDKEVPISFNVTASNLGTKDTSYYTNRGGENPIYNLTETGQVEDGKYILVGYIPSGATGVNGSIDITAYIDASNIAISDTVSRIENGNLIYGETPGDWIAGREVFTTTEWNSFNSNPLSFKVRVEANEGIWVEEEPFFVMSQRFPMLQDWRNVTASITSIEFHKDGVAPANPLSSFDATDVTSKGPVTVYTVDDGLGNNTRKAIIVADDVIYAPAGCQGFFSSLTNLKTFNSENFKVDNVTNMMGMFGRSGLYNLDGIKKWNVGNVTNMGMMFYQCVNLSDVNGLINWNVSNVTSISQMFQECNSLNNISGLANWNVSSVNLMGAVFGDCPNLIDFSPLINWNTGNVTNMQYMFAMSSDTAKTGNPIIDFSSLANWNVSRVENMAAMFQNVNVKSYLSFKNWNVGKVQNFSNMFNATDASTITTLEGLENWNVSSATDMGGMFQDNVSLTDASAINNWNIISSINFSNMFKNTPVHPEFTRVSGTWSNGTFTPNA